MVGRNSQDNFLSHVHTYTHTYFLFFSSFSRLKDGTTRSIGHGAGGHCKETGLAEINIPEGVYLTRISGYDGGYLDWVQFHLSNGAVYKPYNSAAFGSKTNFDFSAEHAVIKAVSFL